MCHNIPRPTLLPSKACYYVFKKNIKPEWEDPENAGGGRVILSLNSPAMKSMGETLYFDLLLLIIGNQLPTADRVCGCTYQFSKDLIELWIHKAADENQMMDSIVSILNEILTLKGATFKLSLKEVSYKAHPRS